MPNEYKEYIHLIKEAKFASISSIAQICNASACLSHSSGPWILDFGACDHLSTNKDIFSFLTITSPLPMITLANGSQTMAKRIGSACHLPFVPLTFVLYVLDSLFNLISINKLTRDLNCLITFSDNSVTLQDQSTGRTIGIRREFQGLFHLSLPSSFTVCTSLDTPLLIHNRLGHPNISKFRKMVPCFSSLSLIECESCQLGKHTRFSTFPLMSLVVSVLSIFLLLDKTSSQPKPRNVSSSVIPDFNKDITAILLIHIDILSFPMSHFFRTLLCFLPPTLPVLMSYFYPFFIPFRKPHLYLRLLHIDHCRFILVARVLTPSLRLTHLL